VYTAGRHLLCTASANEELNCTGTKRTDKMNILTSHTFDHGRNYYHSKEIDNDFFAEGQVIVDKTFVKCSFKDLALVDLSFHECTFENCSFESSWISSTDFFDCLFSDCDFNHTVWSESTVEGTHIGNSSFIEVFSMVDVVFKGCSLIHCSFKNKQFGGDTIAFDSTKLRKVEFENYHLEKVMFIDATINQCRFSNTELTGTNFTNSIVKNSTLINSKLTNTIFEKTRLIDSSFVKCTLDKNVKFSETCFEDTWLDDSVFPKEIVESVLIHPLTSRNNVPTVLANKVQNSLANSFRPTVHENKIYKPKVPTKSVKRAYRFATGGV
jgi:uncharacterized protein YjbI with pentapeptide repeats